MLDKEGSREERRIAQIMTNLAKEFQTPLSLMLLPLEQLIREEPDPAKKEKLQIVFRNGSKFRNMLSDLLDISHLSISEPFLELMRGDYREIIESILESLSPLTKRKELEVDFSASSDPIESYFDLAKVQKIFQVLIANAIRFNKPGGKISIAVGLDASEENLKVSIMDTGIGIVPEKVPHVFDPFYQEETHLRLYQSTGLGLFLIKKLVESLHGTVSVTSEKNVRTTFTVLLPLLDSPKDFPFENYKIIDNVSPSKVIGFTDPDETSTMDIIDVNLLGQQNQPIALRVGPEFEDKGLDSMIHNEFRTLETADFSDGIAQALEHIPDVILLHATEDWHRSLDLLTFVKEAEATCHIPVIFLVDDMDEGLKIKAIEKGADDVLESPINVDHLRAKALNVVELRRQLFSQGERLTRQKLTEIKAVSIDEAFLGRLDQVIDENMDNENFDMKKLSDELYMSRTQIHRKLKALTEMSTTQYIRTYKLKKAYREIVNKTGNISEISYRFGFSSPAYFTRIFKEEFGVSPSEASKNHK
ncbi:MAG: hypothetical protein SchgKO_13870 [Schleiferiaceae bacterium]